MHAQRLALPLHADEVHIYNPRHSEHIVRMTRQKDLKLLENV